MKCHKPNTDQSAEVTILVNGSTCTEYALPFQLNKDPNTLECFVPVQAGDQLTISGEFTGTVLHGSFDLLADGSFLGDRRIEGSKSGEVKHHKRRRVDFRTFFDVPTPGKPCASSYIPDKVIEGNLVVRSVHASYNGRGMLGRGQTYSDVGSLTIIVSLNQESDDNYANQYPSMTCGDWSRRDDMSIDYTNPGLTYQLEVQPTDMDVSKMRQRKHKRHFVQTHFGRQPWAKLIFYYRNLKTIGELACKKLPTVSRALEAGADNARSRAKPSPFEDVCSERTYSASTPGPEERDDVDSSDPLTARQKRVQHLEDDASDLPNTPSPVVMKKKLFGQLLPASAKTAQVEPQVKGQTTGNEFSDLLQDYRQERESSSTFSAFNEQLEANFERHAASPLLDFTEEELAAAVLGTKTWLGNTVDREMLEAAADSEPRNIDSVGDLSFAATSSLDAMDLRTPPNRMNDDPYYHPEGDYISSGYEEQVRESVESPQHPSHNVPHVLRKGQGDLGYFGESDVTAFSNDLAPPGRAMSVWSVANQTMAGKHSSDRSHGTTKPYVSNDKTMSKAAASFSIHSNPGAEKCSLTPPASIPKKRALSSLADSRENSPHSKKQHLNHLSIKKAQLLQQIEEKKQRKIVAQKAVADLQRMRDEEEQKREEVELREIQMLERQAASEDEEYEQFETARKIAEEQLREARMARENAKRAIGLSEEA